MYYFNAFGYAHSHSPPRVKRVLVDVPMQRRQFSLENKWELKYDSYVPFCFFCKLKCNHMKINLSAITMSAIDKINTISSLTVFLRSMDCFYLTINVELTVLKYPIRVRFDIFFTFFVCFGSRALSKQSFHPDHTTLFHQLAATFQLRSIDGIHTNRRLFAESSDIQFVQFDWVWISFLYISTMILLYQFIICNVWLLKYNLFHITGVKDYIF